MMERRIIIASHNHMASGLKSTIEFLAGIQNNIVTLDAYTDGKPIGDKIEKIFNGFPQECEVVIFTDLLSGSVNQKFFPYRVREHVHLITGMNLPIILAMVLNHQEVYLEEEQVSYMVQEARSSLVYVNEMNLNDEGDE
ncbi:PTS N-acetylglucosamine transporter subunit IIBC [Streptococcus mutans]|nr:PTS N-acetylglucosamine transporter subunit IIBC [Streptococcus mutans]NLQ99447.1 PTS N-acetylglucosamine transporter subunit IIBC [Streptococcus mutans]